MLRLSEDGLICAICLARQGLETHNIDLFDASLFQGFQWKANKQLIAYRQECFGSACNSQLGQ